MKLPLKISKDTRRSHSFFYRFANRLLGVTLLNSKCHSREWNSNDYWRFVWLKHRKINWYYDLSKNENLFKIFFSKIIINNFLVCSFLISISIGVFDLNALSQILLFQLKHWLHSACLIQCTESSAWCCISFEILCFFLFFNKIQSENRWLIECHKINCIDSRMAQFHGIAFF